MCIYLDNAATTRLSPQVFKAMAGYFAKQYGNPGSIHTLGRAVAAAIQTAREQTAKFLGCKPEQVIFTSGGSESNSMVFKGLCRHLKQKGKTHLVVSAIEHDSVLKSAASLIQAGFAITYLFPQPGGQISPQQVEESIRPNTGLVSVQFVNNETGVVQDISAIGKICASHSVFFHSDCVQAAGQFPIQALTNGMDFASVSAHKIHGPKGIGALFVKTPTLAPLICGGTAQEYGLRGGTENVPGIVGLGQACELTGKTLAADLELVTQLKQQFYAALRQELGAKYAHLLRLNASVNIPGKILNFQVNGVDGETLVLLADTKGVCISAGSACRSHEAAPSHVLTAMGLSREEARSSVRVSFSPFNTKEEVVKAAKVLAESIQVIKNETIE